jgi:hypothetical protein
LWAMDDIDGPDIAEEFYRYYFRRPGKIDVKDSAVALNLAIREMRRRKGLLFGKWINFVHIGT